MEGIRRDRANAEQQMTGRNGVGLAEGGNLEGIGPKSKISQKILVL